MPDHTWWPGNGEPLPDHAVGVCWADGTVECRFRLLDPAGSRVTHDGERGVILVDGAAECTVFSDACAT